MSDVGKEQLQRGLQDLKFITLIYEILLRKPVNCVNVCRLCKNDGKCKKYKCISKVHKY